MALLDLTIEHIREVLMLEEAFNPTGPMYFVFCRLCLFSPVSRLCTPAYRGLRVHNSQLRPNQTLVSYS
jgi:hypothetical protein